MNMKSTYLIIAYLLLLWQVGCGNPNKHQEGNDMNQKVILNDFLSSNGWKPPPCKHYPDDEGGFVGVYVHETNDGMCVCVSVVAIDGVQYVEKYQVVKEMPRTYDDLLAILEKGHSAPGQAGRKEG